MFSLLSAPIKELANRASTYVSEHPVVRAVRRTPSSQFINIPSVSNKNLLAKYNDGYTLTVSNYNLLITDDQYRDIFYNLKQNSAYKLKLENGISVDFMQANKQNGLIKCSLRKNNKVTDKVEYCEQEPMLKAMQYNISLQNGSQQQIAASEIKFDDFLGISEDIIEKYKDDFGSTATEYLDIKRKEEQNRKNLYKEEYGNKWEKYYANGSRLKSEQAAIDVQRYVQSEIATGSKEYRMPENNRERER